MMRKKGQAAMEFLMTYGWAILVVLAAVAALAYFGVLNPDRFLPEKCTMPSGIACLDSVGSQTSITLRLQNAAGFDMSNIALLLEGANSSAGDVTCTGITSLSNGQAGTATCTASYATGKLNAPIIMNYTNQQTSLVHVKSGELILKIE